MFSRREINTKEKIDKGAKCVYMSFAHQEFLLKIFCVFRNLMKLTIFPRDWSVMRLLTSQ